jgi:hypothetical protein
MQAKGLQKIALLIWMGLFATFTLRVSLAAPPSASAQNQSSRNPVAQNLSQNFAHIAAKLDLSTPSHAWPADVKPKLFPSAINHRQFGVAEESTPLPLLNTGNQRIRPPIAELARHIQHEGLPVARLWENNSTLVHLGLNQKGKPGLWLVQKIH